MCSSGAALSAQRGTEMCNTTMPAHSTHRCTAKGPTLLDRILISTSRVPKERNETQDAIKFALDIRHLISTAVPAGRFWITVAAVSSIAVVTVAMFSSNLVVFLPKKHPFERIPMRRYLPLETKEPPEQRLRLRLLPIL